MIINSSQNSSDSQINDQINKVQYFIIASSLQNKSGSFSRKTKEVTKSIFKEYSYKGNLPGVAYDQYLIQHELLNLEREAPIQFSGTLLLSDTNNDDKAFVLSKIKKLFKNEIDSTILFLTGHGNLDENGLAQFIIESDKGYEKLYYLEIIKLWQERSSKTLKNLLIVIDSCHSGGWVEENIFHKHNDVFIQASCKKNELSIDLNSGHRKGGLLIYNLTKSNKEENGEIITDYAQNPIYSGCYFKAKRYFHINVMYDNWDEMKRKLTEIKYDNGVYKGFVLSYYYFFQKKNGRGSYYWNNGNRYEGEWKNDIIDGKGSYYYNNGDRYEGEWKNGIVDGKGSHYWNNGDRYEGEWKDNKHKGKGIYYWNNGDRYEGEWKNGIKDGKGILYLNNGDRYEGEWKNDIKDGKGILYLNNGIFREQIWKEDKLLIKDDL